MSLVPEPVILSQLGAADAEAFYRLYAHPAINNGTAPFLPQETPLQFLQRISGLCKVLYGIRPVSLPGELIGDCALHHWIPGAKSMEIGGSLLPEYRGRGIMPEVFRTLQTVARDVFRADTLIGRTSPDNRAAIRLVERLGYSKTGVEDGELVLSLHL